MSFASMIEDMVGRFDDDQHRLEVDSNGQSPEVLEEARRLHEECRRMLIIAEAVRKELGDPDAQRLDLRALIERKNDEIARLSSELDRERELRRKADSECAEAKKKIADMNGHAAMYGEGSGLVHTLQERNLRLSRQNRTLSAEVAQLRGKRKAKKREQAMERRRKKWADASTVVVETKGSRASRSTRP